MSPGAVPVVMYHSVTTQSVAGFEEWEVTPGVFASQIGYLVDNGYEAIPLAQYARWLTAPLENPLPPKPVVLTFDDGYVNFSHALEVLARYKLPATMFVPSAYIGGTSTWLERGPLAEMPIMSWAQLAEIRDAGIEVGGHAHVHRPLDELSRQQVRDDVRRCKEILEDGLGAPVPAFAYPHGYFSTRVRGEIVGAGFEYACAVKNSLSGPGDDPFAIARLFTVPTDDLPAFDHMLENGFRTFATGERLVTKGWRFYRQTKGRFTS